MAKRYYNVQVFEDKVGVAVHTNAKDAEFMLARNTKGMMDIISAGVNLTVFSMGQLINIHNATNPTTPAVRFKNKSEAMDAVWARLEEVGKNKATAPEPVGLSDAPVAQAEADPAPKTGRDPKEAKPAKEAKAASTSTRGKLEGTVSWVQETNPKREGSGAHRLFALYKKGMTVEACVEAGMPRNYVAWDVKKGFIKLDPPAPAAA